MTRRLHWNDLPVPKQSHFDWCTTPLASLLRDIKLEFFPHLEVLPHVMFCKSNRLACIEIHRSPPVIYVSSLLSHPAVPVEVLTHILKHELLHLEVKGREIDGVYTAHPPEFWQRESEISNVHDEFWLWVRMNLEWRIMYDRVRERTRVKKRAYKEIFVPDSFDEAAQFFAHL